jgi:hypothetical protein
MSTSTTSRAARLAQGAIVVLATAALVVTFSRGAWLAGLTGLVVGLAILAGTGSGRPVRRWLTTAALALAVVAAIGWLAREPIASRAWLAPTITGTEQRSIDEAPRADPAGLAGDAGAAGHRRRGERRPDR